MRTVIDSKSHGKRLDKLVELQLKNAGFKQTTRSMIKNSIPLGVKINEEKGKPSYRCKQGDTLRIDEEFWKEFFDKKDLSEEIIPQQKKLNILYEDKYLIVLYKPKNMVMHPGVGNKKNTLANYIKGYLQAKNQYDTNVDRAGIVHRLDKSVSGIVVIAKNKYVQEELKKQFTKRKVDKIYLAEIKKFKDSELLNYPKSRIGKIVDKIEDGSVNYENWFRAKGFIGRDRVNRYRMVFRPYHFKGSKSAKGYILPISGNKMLIKILTGRMHQIRATLYYYGCHIKGDTLYKPGRNSSLPEKIMLESIYLSFTHPVSKKKLSFINQKL